jgi:hypothetical protein
MYLHIHIYIYYIYIYIYRNFPAGWGKDIPGSGDHALSEVEIYSMVKAMAERVNICGIYIYIYVYSYIYIDKCLYVYKYIYVYI